VRSPKGALERVRPQDIKQGALLTIEGELDDISGAGQTRAAHDLCTGLPSKEQRHIEVKGAGHYGIFSGRRWREFVYPQVRDFIREHQAAAESAAPVAAAPVSVTPPAAMPPDAAPVAAKTVTAAPSAKPAAKTSKSAAPARKASTPKATATTTAKEPAAAAPTAKEPAAAAPTTRWVGAEAPAALVEAATVARKAPAKKTSRAAKAA
jgi:poly(3-hydroxybutyrate) depolymerase